MSGGEIFGRSDGNGPGPYRDDELAMRLAADPVPDHRPGFWSDLQDELDPPTAILRPGPAAPTIVDADGPSVARWSPGRVLLGAAAAVLAVALAGVAVVMADRTATPIESAGSVSSGRTDQTTSTVAPTTTAGAEAPTTPAPGSDVEQPLESDGPAADYFGAAEVTVIGSGVAVGFSPDDSAALIVDDAPGSEVGCEGAELLTLYAQDLSTGTRRAVLPEPMTIETGGIDLRVLPGPAADRSGARDVYWTEYCDGSRSATWRAMMAPDGSIAGVESVAADSLDDAFSLSGVPTAEVVGATALSPDGTLGLYVDDGAASVGSTDPDDGERRDLPESAAWGRITGGTWDPSGTVVALAADQTVVLWDVASGTVGQVAAPGVGRVLFDNSGQLLALVSFDPLPSTSVVTFGGAAPPLPTPDRCSGDVDLAPIGFEELAAGGLSDGVASLVAAIDEAAAMCAWDALDRLVGPDFVASFGGGGALEEWRAAEALGGSPMWWLRVVLRQPYESVVVEGQTFHAWPAVSVRDGCESFTEADRRSLAALGYSEEAIATDCELFGGYGGYRTAIDDTATWRYFTAGD